MAELLSKWINQDVGLSIPVQSFERDFSNGFYLGELLLKLGLASPSAPALTNSAHPHSLTANWGQLSAALKNAGIKFDAGTAKDIMGQKAGAALKLLYQIKMAVQAREQREHQQAAFSSSLSSPLKGGSKTATGTLPPVMGASERSPSPLGFSATTGGAGLVTLVSPKGHQPARPLDRLEQRRLADNLLHLSHSHAKQKHMDMHLAPFARARAVQEEKQREETRLEAEARAAALREKQAASRAQLQQNQSYTRTWNSGGMQEWRQNMERIDATKAARREWNAKLAQKDAASATMHQRELRHEVAKSIDDFERNLERIGAGANNAAAASSSANDDAAAAAYQSGGQDVSAVQLMSAKLSAALGSPAQLAKQSAEHMARIHDKVAQDALARKERDRRRRKVLVEQAAQSEALAQQQRDDLFLAKLQRESAEERALGEEAWRTQQLYEVIKSNSAYRAQQEALVREENDRLARLQQQSHYESLKAEHEAKLRAELARFESIRADEKARQHQENTLYAAQVAQRLVDVAMKTAAFREVTEQALVPPRMWREWMRLFVQGLPLLPSAADGSEVDAEEASEGSNPDLDATVPTSLLAHMTLSPSQQQNLLLNGRASATPSNASIAATPKAGKRDSTSAKLAGAGVGGGVGAAEDDALFGGSSTAAASALTPEGFYASLRSNRDVALLMSSLRDVSPSTAAFVDEQALEDYLHARNEWSYDIREVAPPELVSQAHGGMMAQASVEAERAGGASGSNASLTSQRTPRSSRPASSKKSMDGSTSPNPALASPTSAKKKEAAAAAAAAAAAEAEQQSAKPAFTSLSFLPPLHPSDSLDLSEPLSSAEDSSVPVAQPTPALQNPLFGALLQRVLDVAAGKETPPDLPELPRFPLALALLGKPYSGRSTQAHALREKYGLAILRVENLVTEGLQELEALEAAAAAEKLASARDKKSGSASSGRDSARKKASSAAAASAAASAQMEKDKTPWIQTLVRLKKGLAKSEPLSDDLAVALIVEAIKRLPARVEKEKKERQVRRDVEGMQRRMQQQEQEGAEIDPVTGEAVEQSHVQEHEQASLSGDAPAEGDDEHSLVEGEGGFVLLGFPSTLSQAQLLETALSGFELPKPVSAKSTGVPRLSKARKEKLGSKVAPAPLPPAQEGPYPSGLHMVIVLEQPRNEVLLRRALGARIDPESGREFHLDYAQPTEADLRAAAAGQAVSTLKQRLVPVADRAELHAVLPEMFLNYEANEKSLEEWFNLFGTLHVVPATAALADGSGDEQPSGDEEPLSIDATREHIRSLIRDKMSELDAKALRDAELARAQAEEQAIANGETVPPPTHPLEAAYVDAPNAQAAAAHAAALAAAQAAAAAAALEEPVSPVPSRKQGSSAAAAAAQSASSSAAALESPSSSDVAALPPQSYPVFSGPELYSFASSGFFDVALATLLAQRWEHVERQFIQVSKHVFRSLRAVRAANLEYFASTRRNFFSFLRRADSKPLLLQNFQSNFNAVPLDLRADQATKDELHLRVDELGEQLWKVNAAKLEENEAEFARIVGGGGSNAALTLPGQPAQPPNDFLEAQHAALYFYYALLAQVEVDRYLATVRLAQDFFASLKGHVIHDERGLSAEEAAAAAAAAAGKKKGDASSSAGDLSARGGSASASGAGATSQNGLTDYRGGLGHKLHVALPLQLSKGDPKVRAAKKKELEAAAKKAAAAAGGSSSAAGAGASNAAGALSSSSSSASKKGSSSKSLSGLSAFGLLGGGAAALASSRKRFSVASPSLSALGPPGFEEADPFAELVEIVRRNFVESQEAVDQISAGQDLESLVNSVAQGANTGKAGKGAKAAAAAKAASGASGAAGAAKPAGAAGAVPQQGGSAGGATPARSPSAGKKRPAGKGAPVAPVSSASASRPASREALLDAQLRALIQTENRLLSARIRRLHRNALLEMAQLRFYTERLFLPKLDQYLELRVRGESSAIDACLYYLRTRIESEAALDKSLRLEGENMFLDADVLHLAPPEETLPKFDPFSDMFDPVYANRMTFAQIIHVTNQLKALCVGGTHGRGSAATAVAAMDVKAAELYTLFLSQYHAAHSSSNGAGSTTASFYPIVGENHLPVKWGPGGESATGETKGALLTASAPAFFRELVGLFTGGVAPSSSQQPSSIGSVAPIFARPYVDYRDFLLSLALLDSVATPSLAQVLSMQSSLAAADVDQDGRVSWAEFASVPLWIETGPTGDALAQRGRPSDSRTAEPVQRLKEFFFHLFAVEQQSEQEDAPVAPGCQTFVLPVTDLLLYLCFDDEEATGGGNSGLEKAQLLVSAVPQERWGPLTPAFVTRYLQPSAGARSRSNYAAAAPSTTAADKFRRKDLTKAAQAGAAPM